jgi:hypothetical protein
MAQSQMHAGMQPEVYVSILLLLNFIILKCLFTGGGRWQSVRVGMILDGVWLRD